MGAVENLAVAQLPLHVADDALPQRAHPDQVVRERLVHDAKDALPVCARHGRLFPSPCQPLTRLIGTWCYRLRRSVRRIRRSEVSRMRTLTPAAAWITISVWCSSPETS